MHARGLTAAASTRAPELLSVLRIVAAFIFVSAGTTILLAFPAGMPPDNAAAVPGSQIWIGGVLEAAGGALLLLGLWTRPVAFLLSGEMAVAYFQFHFPNGFWPTLNGGVAAALYCFVWLYVAAAGPGPWSLDALLYARPGAASPGTAPPAPAGESDSVREIFASRVDPAPPRSSLG